MIGAYNEYLGRPAQTIKLINLNYLHILKMWIISNLNMKNCLIYEIFGLVGLVFVTGVSETITMAGGGGEFAWLGKGE